MELIKNKSIFIEAKKIEEVKDDKRFRCFVETLVVPFDDVSRNGNQYDKESIKKTHQLLVTKPVLFNHKSNGDWNESKPYGEWVATEIREDGMYGKYGIYNVPYTQEVYDYLKSATKPRHSLNVTGRAEQAKDDDGKYFTTAFIDDWHEASIVPVPGFDSAVGTMKNEGTFIASIKECFGKNCELKKQEKLKTNFIDELTQVIDKYL